MRPCLKIKIKQNRKESYLIQSRQSLVLSVQATQIDTEVRKERATPMLTLPPGRRSYRALCVPLQWLCHPACQPFPGSTRLGLPSWYCISHSLEEQGPQIEEIQRFTCLYLYTVRIIRIRGLLRSE